MYSRMLLLLAISLYASRVILQTLGVEDYGTYNVVAGVVVMFTFVNGALSTATQRHLSFERGKNDGRTPELFSACLHVHFVIGCAIVLLAETIGLWFINTQMNFPEGRMMAVNVTYQMAILCCFCSIYQTPYDAAVIAYERMSFYAYYGIIEALLKLGILFLLPILPYDKLIAYSVLHFGVVGFMLLFLVTYVHKKLTNISIVKVKDKSLYKYLLSFSGWTFFGSLGQLMESQGLNIIINIFYGVALNAAVGIANQVRGMIAQFVNGFQQALNPQLVMSHAEGSKDRQFDLIYKSSKFSYYILIALAFPVFVNLDYLLNFWLGEVPNYTTEICYFVIGVQIIECLASPLYTTIFAVGNIKTYQIVVFIFRALSLLFGLAICYASIEPYYVFLAPCIVALILLVYRLLFVHKSIHLSIMVFFKAVLWPVCRCTLLSLALVIAIKHFINWELNFGLWMIESVIVFILTCAVIWILGIDKNERASLITLVANRLKK